ncbi:hypothetical protein YC2023_085304 [Brassica napus]
MTPKHSNMYVNSSAPIRLNTTSTKTTLYRTQSRYQKLYEHTLEWIKQKKLNFGRQLKANSTSLSSQCSIVKECKQIICDLIDKNFESRSETPDMINSPFPTSKKPTQGAKKKKSKKPTLSHRSQSTMKEKRRYVCTKCNNGTNHTNFLSTGTDSTMSCQKSTDKTLPTSIDRTSPAATDDNNLTSIDINSGLVYRSYLLN